MLQSFHVDYDDIWFRSRVDCPLRRVGIFFWHESSFIPVMASDGILKQIQRIRFYVDEIVFIRLRPELPVRVASDGMEGDVLWVRRVVPNEIDSCDGSSRVLRVKSSWMGLTTRIDAIDGAS